MHEIAEQISNCFFPPGPAHRNSALDARITAPIRKAHIREVRKIPKKRNHAVPPILPNPLLLDRRQHILQQPRNNKHLLWPSREKENRDRKKTAARARLPLRSEANQVNGLTSGIAIAAKTHKTGNHIKNSSAVPSDAITTPGKLWGGGGDSHTNAASATLRPSSTVRKRKRGVRLDKATGQCDGENSRSPRFSPKR